MAGISFSAASSLRGNRAEKGAAWSVADAGVGYFTAHETSFVGNVAAQEGGGGRIAGNAVVSITSSSFEENRAEAAGSGRGGGLLVLTSLASLTLRDLSWRSNVAFAGAAVYWHVPAQLAATVASTSEEAEQQSRDVLTEVALATIAQDPSFDLPPDVG